MGPRVSRVILGTRDAAIHAGDRALVAALTLEVRSGEFIAMLGLNGAGKTLTLHTLAGLRPPASGHITLDGKVIGAAGRRYVAQRVGVLMQDLESAYPTSALESVLIGRHPHLAAWQWESEADYRIARAMLARVGLGSVANRSTATLSGGEQRRVAMAALLAQEPQVFLLDEPTNHLDPHHQLQILNVFREQTHTGRAVVATLHDPTIAARYADRVLLLHGDGNWTCGATHEVLTATNLSGLYLTRIAESSIEGRRVFVTS